MYHAEKNKVVHDYTSIVIERLASHCEPGGKVLMSMESIAASGTMAADQSGDQQAGSKRKWKCFKSAGAIQHVQVKLPGPFVGRRGEGGAYIGCLEANPKWMVATVMNWCEHNLSIRAASRAVAYELESWR